MGDYERITKQRDKIRNNIVQLETGLANEKTKKQSYEMYIKYGSKEYDPNALLTQIDMCDQNLKLIQSTIDQEYVKLDQAEQALKAAHEILQAHQTTPCLVGAADHQWIMLEGRIDSSFKRRCSVCGTEQRVGHVK